MIIKKFFNPDEIQLILNNIKNNNQEIYIMGVGGCSMKIIADFLNKQNYIINGVDITKKPEINFNKFFHSHNIKNITDNTKLLIVSHFFYDEDYDEVIYAKKYNIPIILRIDFINYMANNIKNNNRIISIIGTSGKTTTTYMGFCLSKLLNKNPSIFGGSYLPMVGGNYFMDTGDVFIENDESRDEHLGIIADVLIIPSLYVDHVEEKCYENSFEKLKESFLQQINQSKMVIYYSDNGVLDELVSKSNKTLGIDVFNYSDINCHSYCYLTNFINHPLGSMGSLQIKKNNKIINLSLGVPFKGIKNFLNYSAIIFLLGDENNYKNIIDMSRFIYLASERETYCGIINKTVIINTFAQIVEEFLCSAISYKNLFPQSKIYMAIEITRLDRYNREILRLNQLFPYVDKIFMMAPWAKNQHIEANDLRLIHGNYNKNQVEIFYNINEFVDNTLEFCQTNNQDSIIICCNYVKPIGLKMMEKINNY